MPDGIPVRLGFFEVAFFLKLRDDELARCEAILAAIALEPFAPFSAGQKRLGIDLRIGVENADLVQSETFADLEIVEVVAGCDFQRPGAEFFIDVRIRQQRNHPPGNRQTNLFPGKWVVTNVFGVNRHRRIAEHRLRPCGRDDQGLGRIIRQRIADMPELTVALFVEHFNVRQRRLAARAPIDQPLGPVKQPILPKPDERFTHGVGKALVHREAFTLPIARDTQSFQLMQDRVAGFLFPGPHPLDELGAADLSPRQSLFRQPALDNILRGDSRVVRSGNPQNPVTVHSLITAKNILERVVERVPHM